ncbi:hypothetical protein D3C77_731610 [compost metagenome]
MGWIGVVAAIVFLACGALRLARFNLLAPMKGFVGMPITAAGLLLAMSSLSNEHLNPWFLIVLIGGLSFLMVSRIPFPSFKRHIGRK